MTYSLVALALSALTHTVAVAQAPASGNGKTALNLASMKTASANPNVRIVQAGPVKVHTYVNPQLVQVSSHVIELKDSLLVVDAQLTYTFTKEVLAYAKALNKPIARVIITHAHPDHILGAYAYKDYPVFALAETIATIKTNGESYRQGFLKNFGEKDAAPQMLIPEKELKEGQFSADGVEFLVRKFKENEMDVCAAIEIPAAAVFISGDLLYNHVHLYPGYNHLSDWKSTVQALKPLVQGKIILPGHGYATDSRVLAETTAYLTKALAVAALPGMDVAGYKAEMVKAYPQYGGAALMDFGGAALFEKK